MLKSILVASLGLSLLINYGCSTPAGPKIVKTDGDTITVLQEGKKIKIRPDGTTPQKGKGITKHGIFIYADDSAVSSAMEVHQGREHSVDVPLQDWTAEDRGKSSPGE